MIRNITAPTPPAVTWQIVVDDSSFLSSAGIFQLPSVLLTTKEIFIITMEDGGSWKTGGSRHISDQDSFGGCIYA